MNLIKREIGTCSIALYRTFQYAYIPDLLQIMTKYINKHIANYGNIVRYEIKEFITFDNLVDKTILESHKIFTGQKKPLLEILIPSLIEHTFYMIRGSYYVPAIYISDEPICTKVKSISLYSLFCPISLYIEERRVIVLGANIPIARFLNVLFNDKEKVEELLSLLGLGSDNLINEDYKVAKQKFLEVVPLKTDDISQKLNDLFFDDFTLELYKTFYNMEDVSLTSVIERACGNYNDKVKKMTSDNDDSFIDLRRKRLLFSEILLSPVFKTISNILNQLIVRGKNPPISIDRSCVLDYFINKLNMNYLYDLVNGFSCIVSHKATFKLPVTVGQLPRSVSSIHPTYKYKICPVTVSDKDPGISVSLIATQEIDYKFGRFIFPMGECEDVPDNHRTEPSVDSICFIDGLNTSTDVSETDSTSSTSSKL